MLRRLPDMHFAGESLARRSMTPLRQGEAATDQYRLAGWLADEAMAHFYFTCHLDISLELSTCPSRQSNSAQTTLRPERKFTLPASWQGQFLLSNSTIL